MEQCKCLHSFQGYEPAAININFVLKNINKPDILELFITLYQNKEARRKSKNCYTGFGSCNVQNAFVCARMHFQVWHPIRVVELIYVVLHKLSFLLMLLIFQRSFGGKKKQTTKHNKTKSRDKTNADPGSWIGIESLH